MMVSCNFLGNKGIILVVLVVVLSFLRVLNKFWFSNRLENVSNLLCACSNTSEWGLKI